MEIHKGKHEGSANRRHKRSEYRRLERSSILDRSSHDSDVVDVGGFGTNV